MSKFVLIGFAAVQSQQTLTATLISVFRSIAVLCVLDHDRSSRLCLSRAKEQLYLVKVFVA
jgi:hypothetical protein